MIVLAAGGTAGHIFPALAVAEEARDRGLETTLLGERGGMEEQLAAEAGVVFHGVSAGKWHRGRPSPAHALKAATGVIEAWSYLRRLRPAVVIGFGGFASFPGALAAGRLGIPLVLHEGNAFPSKVNRWLAGRASLVISAQEEAFEHLENVKQRLVVPFPVRERRSERAAARRNLGLGEVAADARPPLVTLVMGGSQGSVALNSAVPAAYDQLSDSERSRLEVLHSSGRAHVDALRAATAALPDYHVHGFVDEADAWSVADLAITRAGIGTLSGAALSGVPLIMMPLPSSAEGHQAHNARAVAAAGAGLVVEEKELAADPRALSEAWRRLLEPTYRAKAAAAAAARTPRGAARRILDAVMELT